VATLSSYSGILVRQRAKTCIGYSEKGICDECLALKYNNLLANHLGVPKPVPQNFKYILKFYFETNSLKKTFAKSRSLCNLVYC
jgi:hypothetical protein